MIDTQAHPELRRIDDLNAEIDRLRAELTEIRRWWDTGKAPPEEVATARALAFEEAARWHEGGVALCTAKLGETGETADANALKAHKMAAAYFRALAPLPASLLVALPVETIDQVRGALERAAALCAPREELVFRAALSALLKPGPTT